MMRIDENRNENIFQNDLEIPPVVQDKINAALASIRTETMHSDVALYGYCAVLDHPTLSADGKTYMPCEAEVSQKIYTGVEVPARFEASVPQQSYTETELHRHGEADVPFASCTEIEVQMPHALLTGMESRTYRGPQALHTLHVEMEENEMTKETKKKIFKSWTGAAAAAAAIVMLGGGLAFAAINHFWSDGMQEVLEMDEDQMQTLAEHGNAKTFDGAEAVTVNGVTVQPIEMIADRSSAIISFLVSGAEEGITSGEQLMFNGFSVDMDEGYSYSAGASFYDGSINDEDGKAGFEYIVYIYGSGDGNTVSLLGEQVHIELSDLALVAGKAEDGEVLTAGIWAFDISLPEEDPAITIDVEYPLSETVYSVDQIVISPLSMQVYYRVNGEVEMGRWDNNVPLIQGIRMKDGTVIDGTSELESGYPAFDASLGYYLYDNPEEAVADEEVRMHPAKAFAQARFHRVIDPEDIAEVILRPWGEAYAWGNLPDEIVAEEYGGEIPFERVDVDNIEYWYIPLQ